MRELCNCNKDSFEQYWSMFITASLSLKCKQPPYFYTPNLIDTKQEKSQCAFSLNC